MVQKCLLFFTVSIYLHLVTKVWAIPLHANTKLIRLKAEVPQENEVKRIKRATQTNNIVIYTRHTNRFVRVTAKKITALASSSKDKYAQLILTRLSQKGEVSLKGKESDKYICMNSTGIVVLEDVFKKPDCMFYHVIHASGYEIFRSVSNKKWHLGFKKNGNVRHGHKTMHHHHAAWVFTKIMKKQAAKKP